MPLKSIFRACVVLSLFTATTACQTFVNPPPGASAAEASAPAEKAAEPVTAKAEEVKAEVKEEAKKEEAKEAAVAEKHEEKAAAEPAHEEKKMEVVVTPAKAKESGRHAGAVPADKALGWLKNGNLRYTKGFLRKDGLTSKDREKLVAGQKPHAVVLSCSDSRVPPEIVFDQKLGEIFVVRVAGEALDSSTIASIEYGVEYLGANLVVVMGHESCGAVKAAVGTLNGGGLGSPALNSMVADLHPRLQKFKSQKPSENFLEESWANVDGIAHDLVERSQIIREAVASGEVKIVHAMYHLGSGQVEFK